MKGKEFSNNQLTYNINNIRVDANLQIYTVRFSQWRIQSSKNDLFEFTELRFVYSLRHTYNTVKLTIEQEDFLPNLSIMTCSNFGTYLRF